MPRVPYWPAASESLQPLHTNVSHCNMGGIQARWDVPHRWNQSSKGNTNSILSHLNVLPFIFKIQSYLNGPKITLLFQINKWIFLSYMTKCNSCTTSNASQILPRPTRLRHQLFPQLSTALHHTILKRLLRRPLRNLCRRVMPLKVSEKVFRKERSGAFHSSEI